MLQINAPAQYDDIEGIIPPAQNPHFFGHEEIVEFLVKMCAGNHLHHALLFEGPQGIGKATLAFHFAWAILRGLPPDNLALEQFPKSVKRFSDKNCGKNKELEQERDSEIAHSALEHFQQVDEDCTIWRQIALGCHPGLLHISRPFDAKTGKFRSAITVDEIRKISHFMHQSQADNDWRIVIIDPADDMNRNSANALLKILEEPPRKALFILISHHKGRLLPTIRSRCQSLAFKPLPEEILARVLEKVAQPIGFGQDSQADNQLISKAQGSTRQALLLLTHGGLEIAQALDNFFAQQQFNLEVARQMASVLSNREAHIQFDHFTDHLLQQLAKYACQYASLGNLPVASKLAKLHAQISAEIGEALAYNLDKKNFVLVLLTKLHQELSALQLPEGQ